MEFETRTNAEGVMVTVVCITYNHELYIRDALDSFIRQKTNFKFKVFVGEDCGPDGTAEIVKEYAEKYPDIIVPFLREQNMGAQRNLIDMCQKAESPYIAFCEGDDYWIDDYKLQKQFDYMEANPELRACYCRAEISAPEDWHLRSYYKANKEGKLIFPDCEPGYKVKKEQITCYDYMSFFPAHTSTHFYRWNYGLNIPNWYYEGIIGDAPIFLMQLGDGKAGFIPDVVSVYRRSDVGVFMSNTQEEHFLKTRLDYLRWLSGMLEYYQENYTKYPKVQIENRIKLETYNYLNTAIKLEDDNAIANLFERYPAEARMALNAYLVFYQDSRHLTNICGWDGYQLLVRNRYYRVGLKPYVACIKKIESFKIFCKSLKDNVKQQLKNIYSFFCYWRYTFVPKKKNLWVCSSFNKKGYSDNAKYFYEYVIKQHPEIEIYWLTKDESVYDQLKRASMPVCKFRTRECKKILSRAQIAITDHYAVSDYENYSGFNDRTKVVQLWHGVSLKSTKSIINSTTIPGLRYSDDFFSQAEENEESYISNKLKYLKYAHSREKFEKYFLLVCPGRENVEKVASDFKVPEKNCYICGYPRNIHLHQNEKKIIVHPRVLYAPTFRWDSVNENKLIQQFIIALPDIQRKMEEFDGTFYIRLHPHTWRNYRTKLETNIKKYDRVFLDVEQDIYQTLHEYSVLVTDYSSIAYDFTLIDRPVVFFCYDYDEYSKKDTNLTHDYFSYTPGEKTYDWENTLIAIEEYVKDSRKDQDFRHEIAQKFFDLSKNDVNNSERIVQEIKNRLVLE